MRADVSRLPVFKKAEAGKVKSEDDCPENMGYFIKDAKSNSLIGQAGASAALSNQRELRHFDCAQ